MGLATAGVITGAVLMAVYGSTLAPGVTFWDAGELIAATETLGIPHPPGTPLWVLVSRAWSDLLFFTPRSVATNLLAAASVSAATAVMAALVARWSGRVVAGVAAGLCAGAMSTVWLNATETEVYALGLLLSALMLYTGERAGRTGEWRWLVLTGYLFALAVPLHLSALVAAPAAIVLATHGAHGELRWRAGVVLGVIMLGTAAVGTVSFSLLLATVFAIIAVIMLSPRSRRVVAAFLVGALALSLLLFLPLRALHDPWLNSQNPADWGSLWELVGRQQYGEHPIWPRRAPLWAQLGMLAQYADWQAALGITPGIVPSMARVTASLTFIALAVIGAGWHRTLDRRSWLAVLSLLICGTVGIAAYMNFRPGPTFGHGILPAGATHEARERDYFFLLGFWSWGAWAGMGAVRLAMRLPHRGALVGVALAASPFLLNWRAADRSREPEALLPALVASSLLGAAPPRAVLITAGDNDTYPAWHAQAVEGLRADVVVIVSPMLNARWYREELARRHGLLRREVARSAATTEAGALTELAVQAGRRGHPLVVASTLDASRRRAISERWTLVGALLEPRSAGVDVPGIGVSVDTVALREFAEGTAAFHFESLRDSTDPTARVMAAWLECPRRILELARRERSPESLATVCKL